MILGTSAPWVGFGLRLALRLALVLPLGLVLFGTPGHKNVLLPSVSGHAGCYTQGFLEGDACQGLILALDELGALRVVALVGQALAPHLRRLVPNMVASAP